MLTKEAFNALLKILEEPPGHVKFIFSTTECEKLPAGDEEATAKAVERVIEFLKERQLL